MKGKLIVFEGCDKVGKTTQINILKDLLLFDEIKHKVFSYPNRQSLTFNIIDLYQTEIIDIHPKAIHLLYSANRWESQTEIQNLINEGFIVLVDRYFYSGIAYSHGTNSLDINWCLQADSGLLCPDIVFYLDIDEETMLDRLNKSTENDRYENIETQRKIQDVYKLFIDEKWVVINGNRPVENVSREIIEHLKFIFKN